MFGDEARVPAARQADFAVSSRHWRLAELSVQGMTCTACSTAVERALRSMDGVRSASVVLLREMAEVEYDSSMIDPPKLVDAVENIGFTAALRTSNSASSHIQVAQFRIQGMHCSSCSTSVEENVSKHPGVLKVSVALTLGEARVTFDRHTTTENDIVMAIEGAGFEAGIIENKSASKVTFELEENYIDTVDTIEKTISTYPGVAEVAVDIIESSIEITFHQEVTGPRDLLRRLEEDGYQARLASNGEGLLDRQRSEAAHWKFLFLASLVFTVPVFAFAMILPKIAGMQGLLKLEVWGFPFGVLTKWILTTPVQFVIGWRFQAGAYKSIKSGGANMDVLIAIGTNAAYFYSVISIIEHRLMEHSQADYIPTDFFETSAMLITFILLGKFLESLAKRQTSAAITALVQLIPETATVVTLGNADTVIKEEEIASTLVQWGDYFKVYPGARVPTDGEVVIGESYIDEAMITGESKPVFKKKSDPVIGGTVNKGSSLIVRATRVGTDTALSQIIRLVEQAQMSKAPVQKLADRISSFFVPSVVSIAICTWLVWYIAGKTGAYPVDWVPEGHNSFLFSLLFGIAVLVVACPCALGLATPTAVMVGTGIGAKLGIYIKGGEALETAHKVDVVIFDKTGTLTMGKPAVVGHSILDPRMTSEELFALAAAAEATSEHPVAKAIMDASRSRAGANQTKPLEKNDVSWIRPSRDVEVISGKGVVCWAPGDSVYQQRSSSVGHNGQIDVKIVLGNEPLMKDHDIVVPASANEYARQRQSEGMTVVFLACHTTIVGAISIADPPKEEARAVVAALMARGIQCHMVTGDNWRTARAVADSVGISHFVAEVMPSRKKDEVVQLKQSGHVVAMVGDGVNDSPALVEADVGMAIGSGTDIAIEAADCVLMNSNLEDVLTAIDLSKKTFRRIQLNYFLSFGYNVIMIPVAAGVLYPGFRIQLPPWVAGGAMALSSVSVICSSLLLKKYKKPSPVLREVSVWQEQ